VGASDWRAFSVSWNMLPTSSDARVPTLHRASTTESESVDNASLRTLDDFSMEKGQKKSI